MASRASFAVHAGRRRPPQACARSRRHPGAAHRSGRSGQLARARAAGGLFACGFAPPPSRRARPGARRGECAGDGASALGTGGRGARRRPGRICRRPQDRFAGIAHTSRLLLSRLQSQCGLRSGGLRAHRPLRLAGVEGRIAAASDGRDAAAARGGGARRVQALAAQFDYAEIQWNGDAVREPA